MSDHAEKQIERMDKRRKLPAEGKFLAGSETYDKDGNLLPTGTVPAPDPRSRPDQGAVTSHPLERQGAPEPPETPNPWGGTVSESLGDAPGDTGAAQRIHDQEDQSPGPANRG